MSQNEEAIEREVIMNLVGNTMKLLVPKGQGLFWVKNTLFSPKNGCVTSSYLQIINNK